MRSLSDRYQTKRARKAGLKVTTALKACGVDVNSSRRVLGAW